MKLLRIIVQPMSDYKSIILSKVQLLRDILYNIKQLIHL